MLKSNKVSGFDLFSLGLLVYLALAMDLFVIQIDRLLWGRKITISTFFQNSWYVLVVHWCIVIIIWIISGLLVLESLNRRKAIREVISKGRNNELVSSLFIAVVCSILLALVESRLFSSQIPQYFNEYQKFIQTHGSMGFVVWIFQNIYYCIESILVVLLLALIQRAGEIWFKFDRFPYGGIGLLFTWGISHLTHGLLSGLWICLFSMIFGWIFIETKKHWLPSLVFLWIMFFI